MNSGSCKPRLSRSAWLRFDDVRNRPVLLGPERNIFLSDTAHEVLVLCDGQRTIDDIVALLAQRYDAAKNDIFADVEQLLTSLGGENWLVRGDGMTPRPVAPSSTPKDDANAYDYAGQSSGPPSGLLAELTHRCPLQCVYCSNPLELVAREAELETAEWSRIFQEAGDLGVLQVHLSGGEPLVRPDLELLVAAAAEAGLYTNLITAGVTLTPERIELLCAAGLRHVQISLQGASEATSRTIAGPAAVVRRKLAAAAEVRKRGLALTINAPVHALNLHELSAIIDTATNVGAGRLEVAHVQYYGWALSNRSHLMPTADQVRDSVEVVEDARARLAGVMTIDFVPPDQFAKYPKPCMSGWGRELMVVTPSGVVLPCHAAQQIPNMSFDNARARPLADIWRHSDAFNAFRGESWMQDPCRTCERRQIDWGGCRCQALAWTGDAASTDPACSLSPMKQAYRELAPPMRPLARRRPLSSKQRLALL